MRRNRRYTIEELFSIFTSFGHKLLATTYINKRQKLEFQCRCGRISLIKLDHVRRGQGCSRCARLKQAQTIRKYSIESLRVLFQERGCMLLEDVYKNDRTPMLYRCSCGRMATTRLYNFLSGKRCHGCRGERKCGENHWNWNPDREYIALLKQIRARANRAVRYTLKCFKEEKRKKARKYVGYTPEELYNHIVSHPDWPLVNGGPWHIDHIFPISAFVKKGIKDVRLINCLDNLRPMSATENMSKSDDYDEEAFLVWLEKHGVLDTSRN